MVQLVLTKAFLQPAKAAAMCTASRAETRQAPLMPPFLLAQTYLQNGLHQLIICSQYQTMQWLCHRVNMQTPSTAEIHNIKDISENLYHFSIDFKSLWTPRLQAFHYLILFALQIVQKTILIDLILVDTCSPYQQTSLVANVAAVNKQDVTRLLLLPYCL